VLCYTWMNLGPNFYVAQNVTRSHSQRFDRTLKLGFLSLFHTQQWPAAAPQLLYASNSPFLFLFLLNFLIVLLLLHWQVNFLLQTLPSTFLLLLDLQKNIYYWVVCVNFLDFSKIFVLLNPLQTTCSSAVSDKLNPL
jgi:hypothetical protein